MCDGFGLLESDVCAGTELQQTTRLCLECLEDATHFFHNNQPIIGANHVLVAGSWNVGFIVTEATKDSIRHNSVDRPGD